jgi:hypothetical protein
VLAADESPAIKLCSACSSPAKPPLLGPTAPGPLTSLPRVPQCSAAATHADLSLGSLLQLPLVNIRTASSACSASFPDEDNRSLLALEAGQKEAGRGQKIFSAAGHASPDNAELKGNLTFFLVYKNTATRLVRVASCETPPSATLPPPQRFFDDFRVEPVCCSLTRPTYCRGLRNMPRAPRPITCRRQLQMSVTWAGDRSLPGRNVASHPDLQPELPDPFSRSLWRLPISQGSNQYQSEA